MRDDMDSWLVGGNDAVKSGLIFIWSRAGSTNAVRGDAEYYTLDQSRIPVLTGQDVSFPAPAPPQPKC
jgi:hypothetical protein